MAFGVLEVGYPAYATLLATPALAGILLAINSIGSAVGGALYRRPALPRAARAPIRRDPVG